MSRRGELHALIDNAKNLREPVPRRMLWRSGKVIEIGKNALDHPGGSIGRLGKDARGCQ